MIILKNKLQTIYNQLLSLISELRIINAINFNDIPYQINRITFGNNKISSYLNNTITEIACDDLNHVTSIRQNAFQGSYNLISVTIPDSVTTIETSAFSDCTNLTNITIPNSVTLIDDNAFSDCTSLASITIPDSVTTIGDKALYGCTSLTSVIIPNNVITINSYAFSGCTLLETIKIPVSTNIDSTAFDNTDLKTIVFSKGIAEGAMLDYNVKLLENRPWKDATASITEVVIENGITNIGKDAFFGCTNLISITIPDSVTTIGNSALYGCRSLNDLIIPNSVTTIGSSALYDCRNLNDIYLYPTTPPSLQAEIFNQYIPTIHVPIGCGDAYKNATNWSSYASKIIEDPEI